MLGSNAPAHDLRPPDLLRFPCGRALRGGPMDGGRLLLEISDRGGLRLAQSASPEIVHCADDHFDRIVAGCATARREICFEIYQIRRDPVGRRVLTALVAAARRGVAVRVLVDPMGSAGLGSWADELRAHGIDVRWYRPWRPWNPPLRRTHRKLFIVDGAEASVGGINIAAEFSEIHNGRRAWRDVGLWLRGPVASVLRQQFDAAWMGEGGGEPGPLIEVRRGGKELVAVAGGRDGRRGHGAAYIAIADAARDELLLATPYFIPDAPFRAALVRAASRGVRVVVVIPRLCDISWFKHAGRRLYGGLLRAGVEIWERGDRMVHAKVGVVDGCVAAVGSVNLNRRSFHGNAETLVLTSDPRAVAEIHHLIAGEAAAAAEPLSPAAWSTHPDRRRWAELAAAPVGLVF